MRIGLINEYFPPYALGGAEWSTFYLGKKLAEQGHRVVVITPNYGGLKGYEKQEGMGVYRFWLPFKFSDVRQIKPWIHANPVFYFYSAFQIAHIAKREGLAVLHAQNQHSMPGAYLAGKVLGVPTVITVRDMNSLCTTGICLHDNDLPPRHCGFAQHLKCWLIFHRLYHPNLPNWVKLKHFLIFLLLEFPDFVVRKMFLRRMDRVIMITEGLKRVYNATDLLDAGQVQVVYNLPPSVPDDLGDRVEVRERYGLQGKKVVLCVGKMSIGKGTLFLVDAIPAVAQHFPEVVFFFIGRQAAEPTVAPGYESHYLWHAPMPNEEVLRLINAADLIVVPSVWQEPQGRVLLEAMSLGKPVVATRVGGIPETVEDGVSGLLVERKNSNALARAIICLLQDPELSRRMGQEGRRILEEKFRTPLILEKLLSIYQGAQRGSQ